MFLLNVISSHSITIPALLIIWRWARIPSLFYPFALLLWVGALNEFLSLIMILTKQHNMVNSNIYVLLEFIIILFLFKNWNGWRIRTVLIFSVAGLAAWITDNIVWHTLTDNNSLFRMLYSAVVVFLSMGVLSRVILEERNSLFKTPIFLISLTFIIFYSFKAYYESFNLFHIKIDTNFYYNLWLVLSVINLFANLLYTVAILCIQKKLPFTIRY
jgi:hypothetical protein